MKIGNLNWVLLPRFVTDLEIRGSPHNIRIEPQASAFHSCRLELHLRQTKHAGIEHRMTGARVKNHDDRLPIHRRIHKNGRGTFIRDKPHTSAPLEKILGNQIVGGKTHSRSEKQQNSEVFWSHLCLSYEKETGNDRRAPTRSSRSGCRVPCTVVYQPEPA